MRLIAIGDTHGRDTWKEIVKKEPEANVFVFMGDYFDSKDNINAEIQKVNFQDIIDFAIFNPNVILLFGNHDYHYLPGVNENYSGYQKWQKTDIGELLAKAIKDELVRMCYVNDGYMFTHAGVTKTWCEANEVVNDRVEYHINQLFKFKPQAFRFKSGKNHSAYGDDITQSPIWVRPKSLLEDGIPDYIHVVGHTVKDHIGYTPRMIMIDTIASGEYLSITDGVIKTETV